MFTKPVSVKNLCRLGSASAILGVGMLVLSFNINAGPPAGATTPEALRNFADQHFHSILWGAWLQAIGPVLIIFFTGTLVSLAGAIGRLSGWMTLFGCAGLMMVSVAEIAFYIAVLFREPAVTGLIGLDIIYAIQHLYFIFAAPALFIPLGMVILRSFVVPRIFGWFALLLGLAFFLLGILFLYDLALPVWVTAFAGVQTLWWLGAAVSLFLRSGRLHRAGLENNSGRSM